MYGIREGTEEENMMERFDPGCLARQTIQMPEEDTVFPRNTMKRQEFRFVLYLAIAMRRWTPHRASTILWINSPQSLPGGEDVPGIEHQVAMRNNIDE